MREGCCDLTSSSMDRISGGFIFSTLVMRPCMMRKCGLFTFNWTEWNRFWTRLLDTKGGSTRYRGWVRHTREAVDELRVRAWVERRDH